MTGLSFYLPDAATQEQLGAALAVAGPVHALVFLEGDLGAGKTTLARGFLRARGYGGPVRSPTYTLVEPYELATGAVYHLDLYRLGDREELEYLGVRELFDRDVVLLIEWPDRGAGWLAEPDLRIQIKHRESGRDLKLLPTSDIGAKWLQRLDFQILK